MRRHSTIAWGEGYARFSDRDLSIIMFAAPLAIATVVAWPSLAWHRLRARS